MTRKVAEKIARGIADKIECNTADIDDWAEFWGFTREEYEEFLDLAMKALEQESILDKIRAEITEEKDCGKWILYKRPFTNNTYYCSLCHSSSLYDYNYCPNCGSYMKVEEQGKNKDGSNSN